MLIDYGYFTGLLGVGLNPDTGAPSVTSDAERARLEAFIAVYEPEYLELLLGSKVYGEFRDYLASDRDDEGRWERLKSALSRPYSPVACYVYFKYVGEVGFSVTDTGVVSSADESALSPAVLQRRAWNDMVRMNRRIARLLGDGDYGEVETAPCLLETINELGI